MATFRILVAAAVLAVLAAPASAGAAQRATHGHRNVAGTAVSSTGIPAAVRTAETLARRYWGGVACNGQIKVVARSRMAPGMDPTTDAWATFDSSLGANNLAAPASSYRHCAISLARWRWPTAASMSEDWDLLCATVIHETGHLLGHQHDLRPGSVMAPVFDESYRAPPICRSARPRASRR